jgi:uncharacterized protein (DUF2147 family)
MGWSWAIGLALVMAAGCGGESPEVTEEPPITDVVDASLMDEPQPEPTPEPEPADPADAVLGHWYTAEDSAQVHIERVDGAIVGQLVWLDSPTYDEEGDPEFGEPRRDRENPDEALQDRPIIGLGMLKDFTYDEAEAKWTGGTIYDPESGKEYKCQMTLEDPDTLNVRGYIGLPQLGRTEVWRRVPEGEEKTIEETPPTPQA